MELIKCIGTGAAVITITVFILWFVSWLGDDSDVENDWENWIRLFIIFILLSAVAGACVRGY